MLASTWQVLFSIWLFMVSMVVFLFSLKHSKSKQFYSDTFFLWPLGIYVWGDGLILGLFWAVASVIFLFLSAVNILQFMLIFWVARSFFEVIYWLLHQFSGKKYQAPLFKNISWLDSNQAAILYQLMNTALFCLSMFGLLSL